MVNVFQCVVVAIIIVAIFFFVKVRYIKHKLTWIFILMLILLTYIGFLASTAGQDFDLSTFEGSQTAIKLYLAWLSNGFDNMKVLTGQATKLDWSTNKSKMVEKLKK